MKRTIVVSYQNNLKKDWSLVSDSWFSLEMMCSVHSQRCNACSNSEQPHLKIDLMNGIFEAFNLKMLHPAVDTRSETPQWVTEIERKKTEKSLETDGERGRARVWVIEAYPSDIPSNCHILIVISLPIVTHECMDGIESELNGSQCIGMYYSRMLKYEW